MTNRTLVMIMAGGKGSRLTPLTCHRAKPAVPFGGRFRIIDFVLSNFVNSGYRHIYVLTQYMSSSLISHLNRNWNLNGFGDLIEVVPAQMRDFSFGLKGLARFRVNVFQQRRGIGVVLRQIPTKVLTLEDISAPSVFRRIADTRKGLVLVTGPTGSGKSTTLAAIIDHINKSRAEHIITVEDPLEFVHTPHKCIISQREVGSHTKSFSNALRSALREDPDVILVGEMRDLETVSLAMSAAETGHLVFGTLHTNSCPETIDRIIDSYPHEQQSQVRTMLSTSLMAVITQGLLRRADSRGRVAVHEIMLVNRAIRNLIRENKLHQIPSTMETAKGSGMQTMEMALKDAVSRRLITKKQAMTFSNNPNLFQHEDGPRPPRRTR